MRKVIGTLYNKIALLSPRIEVTLRKLYWKNIKCLKKFNPNSCKPEKDVADLPHVDFDKVLSWLKSKGVGKGSLLIVHSSYAGLECTGLSPEQIVDKLLDLVGSTGTLAMPVIRKFKGEPKEASLLTANIDDLVCTYDVKWTPVTSGLLPYTLMRRDDAVVSHFPFNPMCAVGPLAKDMMKHNLDGEHPSPHGPNSSWKFCLDHNASICSIGTDIEHHNTMIHVAEEAFGDWHWSDEEWYRLRKFNIVDENDQSKYKEVLERKPEWGMLHYAEMNVNQDLKKANIMQTYLIGGCIEVGYIDAQQLIAFLRSRNKNGYPYFK